MKHRRNSRRQTVQSKKARNIIGALILLFALFSISQLVLRQQCATCAQQIKRLEQQCATLEQTRLREKAVWDSMRTPEELEAAMVRHGLLLVYPTGDQVVRVHKNGRMQASHALMATINGARPALGGSRQTRLAR